MAGSFFDTNVLIYLASGDTAKADRAEALVGDGGMVSVQVLNEAANVARRKMGMGWDEVRAMLALWRGLLEVRPVTVETHMAGLALAERFGFSVWDAMIVAAAVEGGCEKLWSEDLQDGMVVEGVTVRNPFRVG